MSSRSFEVHFVAMGLAATIFYISPVRAERIIVDPPATQPFTASVVNGAPPQTGAVIVGVAIDLHYDDKTAEQISDPNANLAIGGTKNYTATVIKCVAREDVALSVRDKRGITRIFHTPGLNTAPKCLAHADHVMGPSSH